MPNHRAQPPEGTVVEVQNRAPCVGCGEGLVCCTRPNVDYATWSGGPDGLYWRHDRDQRTLQDGARPGMWDIAPDAEQYGPRAAVRRLNMREHMAGGQRNR